MKDNKGITLIALVITIIVLLILAGVSIAMLTGDNGLLTKASTAKTTTEKAGKVEEVNIALQDALTYVLINKDDPTNFTKTKIEAGVKAQNVTVTAVADGELDKAKDIITITSSTDGSVTGAIHCDGAGNYTIVKAK